MLCVLTLSPSPSPSLTGAANAILRNSGFVAFVLKSFSVLGFCHPYAAMRPTNESLAELLSFDFISLGHKIRRILIDGYRTGKRCVTTNWMNHLIKMFSSLFLLLLCDAAGLRLFYAHQYKHRRNIIVTLHRAHTNMPIGKREMTRWRASRMLVTANALPISCSTERLRALSLSIQ